MSSHALVRMRSTLHAFVTVLIKVSYYYYYYFYSLSLYTDGSVRRDKDASKV